MTKIPKPGTIKFLNFTKFGGSGEIKVLECCGQF